MNKTNIFVRSYASLLALLIFLVFAVLVTGCMHNIEVTNPTPIEVLKPQAGRVLPAEYIIQPGDLLDIKFFFNPELNEAELPVRPDGRISLQLVHEVMAAGRTPAELTKDLGKKYEVELKKPEITVIVRSFGHRVYVDGEVETPTELEVAGSITALQAIARAGGLKEGARIHEVLVIRRGLGHSPLVIPLDLEEAIEGTDLSQDISLLPYDVVYVPLTTIGNVNKWVDQYLRKNIPFNAGIFFRF